MEPFDQVAEKIREQNDLEMFREIVEGQGRKIVLFGAGDCGHVVYHMLRSVNIDVCCFCDNKAGRCADKETGLVIESPEYLMDRAAELAVLICVMEEDSYNAIYGQVLSYGFNKAQIYLMRDYYDRLSPAYLEEHIQKYREAYQILDDEFSKKVFLARMRKVYLLEDISEIVSIQDEEYFDEKVVLTDQEVFIDCGGYDGDTSLKLIEKCHGKYTDIIIFEPELCKKESIEKNMAGHRYQLYQAGVWSEKTRLHFDALKTVGSHVSETESGYVIEAVALDEIVFDRKPTFIKMDIEGSEQEALKGCKRIINEYKPKMAICIYHKPDDLFEIPVLIKRLNPAYRLYLRQYANSRFETVMYAV